MKIFQKLVGFIFVMLVAYFGWLRFQQQKGLEIKQTTKAIVDQLTYLSVLETAQMTILQNIQGENSLIDLIPGIGLDNIVNDFLFREKIFLQIEGIVVAGFDLSTINSGSIIINQDNSINLLLDKAKILHVKLTEGTMPLSRELGLLTKGNIQMETNIRNEAVKMIEAVALQKNILQEAEKNAQIELKKLFETMGVKIKEINYK